MSCGISKSGFLDSEANRFETWLKNNFMENELYGKKF